MNKLTFDHLFKIGLLILGLLLVFELHSYVNNGRYAVDKPILIDTRTGTIYLLDSTSSEGYSLKEIPLPKKK